jgi:phospholipase/lecithinase/hemolysin
MKQYRAALRANMKEQKVPYLEVLELTEAASPANEGFFGELIHPNNMGHRLLASELLKLIERERLLADLNVAGFEP